MSLSTVLDRLLCLQAAQGYHSLAEEPLTNPRASKSQRNGSLHHKHMVGIVSLFLFPGSYYITQTSLELKAILLPLLSNCWDYRHHCTQLAAKAKSYLYCPQHFIIKLVLFERKIHSEHNSVCKQYSLVHSQCADLYNLCLT